METKFVTKKVAVKAKQLNQCKVNWDILQSKLNEIILELENHGIIANNTMLGNLINSKGQLIREAWAKLQKVNSTENKIREIVKKELQPAPEQKPDKKYFNTTGEKILHQEMKDIKEQEEDPLVSVFDLADKLRSQLNSTLSWTVLTSFIYITIENKKATISEKAWEQIEEEHFTIYLKNETQVKVYEAATKATELLNEAMKPFWEMDSTALLTDILDYNKNGIVFREEVLEALE